MVVHDSLLHPELIKTVGTRYAVQKNVVLGKLYGSPEIWQTLAFARWCAPLVWSVALWFWGSPPLIQFECIKIPPTTQFISQGPRLLSTFGTLWSWSIQTSMQLIWPAFSPILCETLHVFFLQRLVWRFIYQVTSMLDQWLFQGLHSKHITDGKHA
jgi:hypothetical protein